MKEYPKKIRLELNQLCGLAHERYLDRSLTELQEHFARWRNKEINAFDLNELIHKFHQGPSRDLYVYFTGSNSMNNLRVARALVDGLIEETEISPETLNALTRSIEAVKDGF